MIDLRLLLWVRDERLSNQPMYRKSLYSLPDPQPSTVITILRYLKRQDAVSQVLAIAVISLEALYPSQV